MLASATIFAKVESALMVPYISTGPLAAFTSIKASSVAAVPVAVWVAVSKAV